MHFPHLRGSPEVNRGCFRFDHAGTHGANEVSVVIHTNNRSTCGAAARNGANRLRNGGKYSTMNKPHGLQVGIGDVNLCTCPRRADVGVTDAKRGVETRVEGVEFLQFVGG